MSAAENVIGLNVHKVVEPDSDQGVHPEKAQQVSTLDVESQNNSLDQAHSVIDDDAYPAPTAEERSTLRKVADSIPITSWSLCVVEMAERASYYGVKAAFNNYLQFPLPEGGPGTGAIDKSKPNSHAGALGLGLQTASALGLLFTFLAYVIPIFGAWIADVKIGRYKAIAWGVGIGGVAHVIMVGGAAPSILQAGKGVAPFLISYFLLAIGAGIFKPNVAPTVIDQYKHQREYTKVLKSGEKVIVDPETTVNHIMLIFYAFINVGAFFSIAVVYIEKYHSFWLAYLVPGIVYFLLPLLLAATYKRTVRVAPQGSDLNRFVKITVSAIKASKGNIFSKNVWQNVRPTALAERGVHVGYSEKDVDDARRTWQAVQIFLYIPIWYLNDGGVGNVQSNQGAAMTSDGAPNDLLSHFNPLVIIVFSPFMANVVYPFLERRNVKFGRISRMTVGFVLAIISSLIGALVQWRVYETSPCGYAASDCDDVSPLSIWWQIPNVALGAMSEIFINVTAYELAYARAPEHMRSTVVALFLFMTALSSALGQILLPSIADPTLIWAWAAPGIALFVQTIVFWFRHRHLNDDVFMTYKEDFESVNSGEKKIVEKDEK
ncbi:POT family protein [Colletotrichum abscissum]|uniref:POT family protein n=1 Tax=Colletotrichum costaricense TaxID=1209916 RepID=A0AAJ0DVY6_9PEZI|nr:POT family protein [Colletotrichum costaricense]XP_060399750.1 POT family protein [Colletotrichum abscissum]KAK1500960.1 POT family protein [Colletotrichum abscissum]KAK1516978.1 POT family protein [Colletotrichum costaricense]